jgi:hypothetical protein
VPTFSRGVVAFKSDGDGSFSFEASAIAFQDGLSWDSEAAVSSRLGGAATFVSLAAARSEEVSFDETGSTGSVPGSDSVDVLSSFAGSSRLCSKTDAT